MSAAEVARAISRSQSPEETCRLLADFARVQRTGAPDGDDPKLIAALRTLDEARKARTGVTYPQPVDRLSASRARGYRPWLWLTSQVDRFARMRGWS